MAAGWRQSLNGVVWLALVLAGGLAIVRVDIAQRREAFQADARIAHRLLSQRAEQQEAVLATLTLLQPAADRADAPERRLPAFYAQVLAVQRRDADTPWADPALLAAEQQSLATRRAALGPIDQAAGQYSLVRAGQPASFALRIDLQRMVPWDEWPIARDGPVRVSLGRDAQRLLLQPGEAPAAEPVGWTAGFVFSQPLASASQPFELSLQRATGPAQWPWLALGGWTLLVSLALAAHAAWRRGRLAQRRAEELLRLGQVARLNALGELAGGMAHELNQPLTACLANTQAARRLLDDDPPELATARQAMEQAAGQARRAAEVIQRLRRLVQAPADAVPLQPVDLAPCCGHLLGLLAPALQARGITARLAGPGAVALADPVALEQIVHNLLSNAMQALAELPAGEPRRLTVQLQAEAGLALVRVIDNGPGIAHADLPRLFEPFFSRRADGAGLGLGLGLCESLASAMGGRLTAGQRAPRGAEFQLSLPLADSAP